MQDILDTYRAAKPRTGLTWEPDLHCEATEQIDLYKSSAVFSRCLLLISVRDVWVSQTSCCIFYCTLFDLILNSIAFFFFFNS